MNRKAASKPAKPQPKQPPVRRARPIQDDELSSLLRQTSTVGISELADLNTDTTDLDAIVSSLQGGLGDYSDVTTTSSSSSSSSASSSSTQALPPHTGSHLTSSASTSSSSSGGADPGLTANFDDLIQSPRATLTNNVYSGIMVQIQNVVSSFYLGDTVNLKELASRARNAEYNPRRFSAVIMRLRNPNATALIFSSGKVVVSGTKAEHESRLAARKFARIVQKAGHENVKFLDFTLHNVVGSADVRFPINLDKLAQDHDQYCSFEAEIFPGLVYRLLSPQVSMLVFVSGRVVLTGAKSRAELYQAFEIIYAALKDYRKMPEVTATTYN